MEGSSRPISSPSIFVPTEWKKELNTLEQQIRDTRRTTGLRCDDPITKTFREKCSRTLAQRTAMASERKATSSWAVVRLFKGTLSLIQELPNILKRRKRFNTVCKNIESISHKLSNNEVPSEAEISSLIDSLSNAPSKVIRRSGIDTEKLLPNLKQIQSIAHKLEEGDELDLVGLTKQIEDPVLKQEAELWQIAMDKIEDLPETAGENELRDCLSPLLDQLFGQDNDTKEGKTKIIEEFKQWQQASTAESVQMEKLQKRKDLLTAESTSINHADAAVEDLFEQTGPIEMTSSENAALLYNLDLGMKKVLAPIADQNRYQEGVQLLKTLRKTGSIAQKPLEGTQRLKDSEKADSAAQQPQPDWSLTLNHDGSFILLPERQYDQNTGRVLMPPEYYTGEKTPPPLCILHLCNELMLGKEQQQALDSAQKLVDKFNTPHSAPSTKLLLMSAVFNKRSLAQIALAFRQMGKTGIADAISPAQTGDTSYSALRGAYPDTVLPHSLVYGLLHQCSSQQLIDVLNVQLTPAQRSYLKYLPEEPHKQCYILSIAAPTQNVSGKQTETRGITVEMMRGALNKLGSDYREVQAEFEKALKSTS